jgi:hypothetical protein
LEQKIILSCSSFDGNSYPIDHYESSVDSFFYSEVVATIDFDLILDLTNIIHGITVLVISLIAGFWRHSPLHVSTVEAIR